MPASPIKDAAAAILLEHGPLEPADLTARIVAAGGTKAKNPRAAVNESLGYDHRFQRRTDGRWDYVPRLLAGSVLTHRLTAEEIDDGTFLAAPDWCLPTGAWAELPLAAGGELTFRWSHSVDGPSRTVTGPKGWLDGYADGDLVGLRFDQPDRASVVPVSETAAAPFTDKRLRDRLEFALDHLDRWLPGAHVPYAVLDVLSADPAAFSVPSLPLSERLSAMGYEVHGDLVGRPGTDWSQWDGRYETWNDEDPWAEDEDDEELAALGLDAQSADALRLVVGVSELAARGEEITDELLVGLALPMADLPMLEALNDGLHELDHVAELGAVARRTSEVCDKTLRGSALLLAAMCAEQLGDDAGAEALALDALAADPTHPLVQLRVARDAEDRGDAARALTLLRKAGVPSNDPQRQRLADFAEPPVTGVSRNAPCPCGSGRKHKACCLATARHPLDKRAFWLRAKATSWALEPPRTSITHEYFHAIDGPDGSCEDAQSWYDDPFAQDLATWGGGLISAYAERRAPLLPADERDLLAQWADVRPGLYEVLANVPGRSLRLRDLVDDTGEHDVTLHSPPVPVPTGALLLTRLLPDGAGGLILGGSVGVPRLMRSKLVPFLRERPTDLELADWMGEASAPPTMQTTDGQEMVACTTVWRVRRAAEVSARLDDDPALVSDTPGRWTVLRGQGDGALVLGSVSLDGDELTIQTMSRERMSDLADLVDRVAPRAQLVRADELPASAVMSGKVTPLGRAPEPLSPDDPEIARVLDQHMRDYERKWVEDSIPALGGLTPREALLDPVRRRDLMGLLDDIAVNETSPHSMSASRIRALLGIPPT